MTPSPSSGTGGGASPGPEPRSRLPTFLFIGPDKSGSTWLHQILRQHPDCYVPALKDLFFFDRYFDKGIHWYQAHFTGAPAGVKAIGELSHDYLFSEVAADRIRAHLPHVTLLSTLRDPVERTFSQYLFMLRSGWTQGSFEDALERHPILIENSLYGKHLGAYLDRFPRKQVRIFYFDRLREDPRAFAEEVFRAIGLEPLPGVDYERTVLPASRPRWASLNRFLRRSAGAARGLGLTGLVARVKRSAAASWLFIPYADSDRPTPAADTERMLRDRFASDLSLLRRILSGPYPRWLMEE